MTAEVLSATAPVYSSCTRRAGASLVDTLLLIVFYFGLLRIFGLKMEDYNIVSQVAVMIYYVAFESSPWQASPGKRALGIYLADKEGTRLSPLRATARYIIYCVPALPFISLMSTDKFKAYSAAAQQAKKLDAFQQKVVMEALVQGNGPLMTQIFIMGAGGSLLYIVLYWLPMIFTKQKTALHDMVTNVRVLRRPQKIVPPG